MLLTKAMYVIILVLFLLTVVPTWRSHGRKAHQRAFYKSFFIWALSTLPVIFTVLAAPNRTLSWNFALFEATGSPFSVSEQLVYASTFLAPVLFIFVEAIKSFLEGTNESRVRRFKHVMKTYHLVLLPSLFLMMLSVFIFASFKTDPEKFKETAMYVHLGSKGYIIYIASLIYWYCVTLIESAEESDFVLTSDRRTRNLTEAARARIGADQ